MKRRSRAGGKPVKTRPGKTVSSKRRNAPKAEHGRNPSIANLQEQLERRTRERDEALSQQTAMADVLRVISSSPGDLKPVFDAILQNATHLCEASFGNLELSENGEFRIGAMYNAPAAFAEQRLRVPLIPPHPKSGLARVVATKKFFQIDNLTEHPVYFKERFPAYVDLVEKAGARTLLIVPLLKEDELVGVFGIYRQDIRPFTEKQIALLQSFASQAVIAIENARLLNELRQRTTDLAESLEQQTATSEVLRVISSSPSELSPVFQTMLANATRLCEAKFGILDIYENGAFRTVAMHNVPQEFAELRRREPLVPADPQTGLGRVLATKKLVHITDYAEDAAYKQRAPAAVRLVEIAGARTLFVVPMLKETELVGVIAIFRNEVRPFAEKQIALVQNFAAQAVIAIENARLLNELRQRTADLTEALEQQTATSNVLEVISRSAFDLHAVFETVAESAVRLCGADRGAIFRFDGELLRLAALVNASAEFTEWVKQHPVRPGRHSASARAALEHRTIHIPDVRLDPEYTYGAKYFDETRTILGVPILKGDDLLGVMIIYHVEVRPFTDKQIALVEMFADQAAIAIENVRLFEAEQQRTRELTDSLEQQTATRRYFKLSEALPAICSRCLPACWRMPFASATPNSEISIAGMAMPCTSGDA